MVKLIPEGVETVLEPTPGKGNLVAELKKNSYVTKCPPNYFLWDKKRIDCIVMNPPFTDKGMNFEHASYLVKRFEGAKIGYFFLYEAMQWSDNIVALVTWYTIINSKKRTDDLIKFGLKKIINLPRSTFKKSRVQTCIIQLEKGYRGITEFINY